MAWDVTHPSLGWQTPTVKLIRINQLVRAHDPYSEWLQAQNIYDIYDNIYQNDILKIFRVPYSAWICETFALYEWDLLATNEDTPWDPQISDN